MQVEGIPMAKERKEELLVNNRSSAHDCEWMGSFTVDPRNDLVATLQKPASREGRYQGEVRDGDKETEGEGL